MRTGVLDIKRGHGVSVGGVVGVHIVAVALVCYIALPGGFLSRVLNNRSV